MQSTKYGACFTFFVSQAQAPQAQVKQVQSTRRAHVTQPHHATQAQVTHARIFIPTLAPTFISLPSLFYSVAHQFYPHAWEGSFLYKYIMTRIHPLWPSASVQTSTSSGISQCHTSSPAFGNWRLYDRLLPKKKALCVFWD